MDHKATKIGQNFVVVRCGMVGVALAIELKLITVREKNRSQSNRWLLAYRVYDARIKALSINPALLKKIKKTSHVRFTATKSIYVNGWLVSKETKHIPKDNDSDDGIFTP